MQELRGSAALGPLFRFFIRWSSLDSFMVNPSRMLNGRWTLTAILK